MGVLTMDVKLKDDEKESINHSWRIVTGRHVCCRNILPQPSRETSYRRSV